MKISSQLKLVRDAFQSWDVNDVGAVTIASDIEDMLTILRDKPGQGRVVVLFYEEAKRGQYEEQGAVDRTFWVIISRGKGLKLDPGATLVEGSSGGRPMFDLVEEARETIRALSFDADTTEVTPNYLSAKPLEVNGLTLTDVFKLEFSIGCQLPAVDLTQNPTAPDSETQ